MVGLPTRLLIAKRVLDRLATEDPAEAARLQANRPWFMLGALGPALGDFVPHQPGTPGGSERSPHYKAWREMLRIAMGDPRPQPFFPLPGLADPLAELRRIEAELSPRVRDRDLFDLGVAYVTGLIEKLKEASQNLQSAVDYIAQPNTLPALSKTIDDARPRINDQHSRVPPNRWTGRDYLHWKRTGEFATRLVADAEASGDDRFIAYARGWQVAYATLVCGSGFVASIAGSVYRTHWWRNRWIANFVDTWVWGYYNQSPASFGKDNYDSWPSLCEADLQGWVQVAPWMDPRTAADAVVAERPLPSYLPAEFASYWIGAWTATYAPGDPTARPGADPLFTAERLQAGYTMTWLVLWFQTSGEVIGSITAPGPPPAACGPNPTPPNWVDPNKKNPVTKKPFDPVSPNPVFDPDEEEALCGVILGLLGAAFTAFGLLALGWGLIAKGLATAVQGGAQLNWTELECQLHWTRVYTYNSLGSLHQTLVLGGFQHPYAPDLKATALAKASFGNGLVEFSTAAEANCRSRAIEGPLQPWDMVSSWAQEPVETGEEPLRRLWSGTWWPSAIVDDDTENPIQASILDPPSSFDSGVGASFGPAVQSALAVLAQRPASLPNWNLDNDRGHGWLTWELHAPYYTPVEAFPES